MASTALNGPPIRWSSQLLFQPVAGGADLNIQSSSSPSATLTTAAISGQKLSDKISLPSSVLESFLAQSSTLPSPLTFRITNPATKKFTHVGIKEFSAEEGTAQVPFIVASRIGLEANQPVVVQYAELPKGTSLTLSVLDEDSNVDNWKTLLEAQMQSAYTALTKGDTLVITDPASNNKNYFQCLVTDVKPEDAVCIVDTDIDLDIVTPVSTTQHKGKGKSTTENVDRTSKEISIGGSPSIITHLDSTYDAKLILKAWNPRLPLRLNLGSLDETHEIDSVNLFVGINEYATSFDSFLWSTLLSSSRAQEKSITIDPSDPYLFVNDKLTSELVISVHSEDAAFSNLVVTVDQSEDEEMTDSESVPSASSDSRECTNCHQSVPSRSYQLHLTFCERNNIVCPLGCGQLFLRREGGIPESHWHCKDCSDAIHSAIYGNTASSKLIHDSYAHTEIDSCPSCHSSEPFSSKIALALHQATTCPNKLHICRFCHLKLPQETASPVDILEGYSGHESHCGSRTTDCPQCKRAVRLRELNSHMEYHNLQRLTNNKTPTLCSNANCVRTVPNSSPSTLGLCTMCFGPLHSTIHDPTGSRLKMRVERRYVIQLTRGCGRPSCTNTSACATANPVKLPMPQVMQRVKELQQQLDEQKVLMFCVDEMTTKRKMFVDFLAEGEQIYSREWVAKAIEETKGSESNARKWLETNAIKISEQ